MQFIESLQSNPVYRLANPLFGFVGVIGVILSICFYFRQKQKRELKTLIEEIELYDSSSNHFYGFALHYSKFRPEYEIKKLYAAAVTIKNSGNQCIHSKDINSAVPMRIVCANDDDSDEQRYYGIIDVRIHNKKSLERNQIKVRKIDDKTIDVSFEFLEPKEEILLYIRYIGTDSYLVSEGDIIDGRIKNSRKNYYMRPSKHRLLDRRYY